VLNSGEPDDLSALRRFVGRLAETFDGDRIELTYPAAPHDDLFGKMTLRQQRTFKDKLQGLHHTLKRADHTDPAEAHDLLVSEFGEAFRMAVQEATSQAEPAPSTPLENLPVTPQNRREMEKDVSPFLLSMVVVFGEPQQLRISLISRRGSTAESGIFLT
jgi:hypothetical protein